MTTGSKSHGWLLEADELKDKVLTRLAEMPEMLRAKAPLKDTWSASEVIEHIIIVEERVAGPWKYEIGNFPRITLGLKSAIVTTMVSAVMARTNVRVRTVPELVPNGGLTFPELRSRWENARNTLIKALPANSKGAWIMHPVFGPLSADQMGKLMVAHLKHHLRHWPTVSKGDPRS